MSLLSPSKLLNNLYQGIHEQDSIEFWSIATSISFAVIIFALWVINFPSLPTKLPLFYSLPWGEEQLANHSQFMILPAIIVLINLINLIISWHLHPTQLALKRTIAVASLVISLLLLITALKILYIFI